LAFIMLLSKFYKRFVFVFFSVLYNMSNIENRVYFAANHFIR